MDTSTLNFPKKLQVKRTQIFFSKSSISLNLVMLYIYIYNDVFSRNSNLRVIFISFDNLVAVLLQLTYSFAWKSSHLAIGMAFEKFSELQKVKTSPRLLDTTQLHHFIMMYI